jgi:CelD/BcsL family acetyltransferase involved in cellulose biosynthesis
MTVISLPRVRHNQDGIRAAEPCVGSLETSAGLIRLSIFRDFELIESEWRAFQANGVCVQAQSYAHAEAWFRLVSKPAGAELEIVCGRSRAGDMEFIWPFEVVESRGVRCLHWIGREHANYNMGLHTLKFARESSPEDVKALLSEAASLIGGVSAAYFDKQPYEWDGVANPMAHLPHRPSANMGHAVLLESDFDTLYRNRFSGKSRNTLGRKERRLREQDPVEMGWARTPEERCTLLDEFFKQKARQFAEQGISDAFADPRHRAFYHEIAALPSGEQGTLEIGYLKSGEQFAAISSGIFFKDKFTTLLTSIDQGPVRKFSPGSLLLHYLIEDACRRGLNFFDMGAGDARHKEEWCDIDTPLFENIIAFDERGYLLTVPLAAQEAVKRFIKTRPKLWALAQSVRRKLYGQRQKAIITQEVAADLQG